MSNPSAVHRADRSSAVRLQEQRSPAFLITPGRSTRPGEPRTYYLGTLGPGFPGRLQGLKPSPAGTPSTPGASTVTDDTPRSLRNARIGRNVRRRSRRVCKIHRDDGRSMAYSRPVRAGLVHPRCAPDAWAPTGPCPRHRAKGGADHNPSSGPRGNARCGVQSANTSDSSSRGTSNRMYWSRYHAPSRRRNAFSTGVASSSGTPSGHTNPS